MSKVAVDEALASTIQPTLGGGINAVWEVVGVGPSVDFTDRETGERVQGRKVHFIGPSLHGGLGRSATEAFVRVGGLVGEPSLGLASVELVIGGAGKVRVACVKFGVI